MKGLVCVLAFICLAVAAAATITYKESLPLPDQFANDTAVYPCSIAVAHSGRGAALMGLDTTTNETIIIVKQYTGNLNGYHVSTKAVIYPDFLINGFSGTADTDTISCSLGISDDLSLISATIALDVPDGNQPVNSELHIYSNATGAGSNNYTLIGDFISNSNLSSIARSAAMTSDGQTIIASSPASTFANSMITIFKPDPANASVYDVWQSISPPFNESAGITRWTEDCVTSANGSVFVCNSPQITHLYVFTRDSSTDNYTYDSLLSVNTTSGALFTSIAISGDGSRIFATYGYVVTEVDNSTSRYNGVMIWTYDNVQLTWGVPYDVNYSVGTFNNVTNVTNYFPSQFIFNPVSSCLEGLSFIAPTYNCSRFAENVTYGVWTNNTSTGLNWTLNQIFPLPSYWPIPTATSVQQLSPIASAFGNIGFSRTLSDSSGWSLVPSGQTNGTSSAGWVDSYTGVGACFSPPGSAGNTNAMIGIIVALGVVVLVGGIIVGIASMR